MADDILDYSISGMEETSQEARQHLERYQQRKADLEERIKNLQNYWKSDETGTFEAFRDNFNSSLPDLANAESNMISFISKLDEKAEDFSRTGKNIIDEMN